MEFSDTPKKLIDVTTKVMRENRINHAKEVLAYEGDFCYSKFGMTKDQAQKVIDEETQ